jgi:hypothetical protein
MNSLLFQFTEGTVDLAVKSRNKAGEFFQIVQGFVYYCGGAVGLT